VQVHTQPLRAAHPLALPLVLQHLPQDIRSRLDEVFGFAAAHLNLECLVGGLHCVMHNHSPAALHHACMGSILVLFLKLQH